MSIYERSYMRGGPYRVGRPVLKWIFFVNLGAFLLQNLFSGWGESAAVKGLMESAFALSSQQLLRLFLWTVVTYGALHGSVAHFLLNSLFIYLIGRGVEALLGARSLLRVYLLSIACGGVMHVLAHPLDGSTVIGASGAVYGLLTLFCLMHYEQPLQLFLLPVVVMGKWILWFFLGLAGFGFLFEELAPNYGGIVSHSAHLGGALGGWLYFRYSVKALPGTGFERLAVLLGGLLSRLRPGRFRVLQGGKRTSPAGRYTVNIGGAGAGAGGGGGGDGGAAADPREEVDRILDKISEQGIGSLTEREREVLERARR